MRRRCCRGRRVGLPVGAALAFPGADLLASRVERSQSRVAKLFLAGATSFLLVSVGTGVVTREVYIETHDEVVVDGRTYTGQREPPGILLASVSLAGGLLGGALGLGLRARALGREELRRLRL